MKKQFVTYPIAFELKELGFNEECFGWYYLNKPDYIEYEKCKLKDCTAIHIPAPLWQQVIDWCDSKGLLVGTIIVDIDKFKSEIKSIGYGGEIFNTRHESIRNAIEFAICYLQNNKPVD